jgi:hypothetical protein
MNSTQCSSCGGQLNEGFDKCPHCGEWNNTLVDKFFDDFANAPRDSGKPETFSDKLATCLFIAVFLFFAIGLLFIVITLYIDNPDRW